METKQETALLCLVLTQRHIFCQTYYLKEFSVCWYVYVHVNPQRCKMSGFCLGVRWQNPYESGQGSLDTVEESDDKTA